MNFSDFENNMYHKLEEHHSDIDANALWDDIQPQLEERPRKPWGGFWLWTLGLLLGAAGIASFMIEDDRRASVEQQQSREIPLFEGQQAIIQAAPHALASTSAALDSPLALPQNITVASQSSKVAHVSSTSPLSLVYASTFPNVTEGTAVPYWTPPIRVLPNRTSASANHQEKPTLNFISNDPIAANYKYKTTDDLYSSLALTPLMEQKTEVVTAPIKLPKLPLSKARKIGDKNTSPSLKPLDLTSASTGLPNTTIGLTHTLVLPSTAKASGTFENLEKLPTIQKVLPVPAVPNPLIPATKETTTKTSKAAESPIASQSSDTATELNPEEFGIPTGAKQVMKVQRERSRLKPWSWGIGLHGGIARNDQNLKSSDQDYLAERLATENVLENLQLGVDVLLRHRSDVYFHTGIEVTRLATRFSAEQTVEEIVEVDGLTTVYISRASNDTSYVYGRVDQNLLSTYSKTIYNNTYLIDIPLLVGYNFYNYPWSFGVETGALLNIAHRKEGLILGSEEVIFYDLAEDQELWYKNKLGLGFYSALNINYALNDKLELSLSPNFRLPLVTTTAASPVQEEFLSVGAKIGIRYWLNGN